MVSVSEEMVKGLKNLYELQLEDIKTTSAVEKIRTEVAEYDSEIQERSKGSAQSEDFRTMRSKRLFGNIDMKGLAAEGDYMKSSINDLKNQLQLLPSLQNRLEMLDMKIDAATGEYGHLKDFHTEILAQLTTNRAEAKVLHSAIAPAAPVQPIKVYHVVLTAFLALLLSIGLVYCVDYIGIHCFGAEADGLAHRDLLLASTVRREALVLFDQLAKSMAARGGSLFMREKDAFVLVHTLDAEHVPDVIPIPPRRGSVFEQVITTKQPLLIENIEERKDMNSSGWKDYADTSLLAFPIQDKTGEIVGVMSLHNKTKPPFTAEEKDHGALLLGALALTSDNVERPDISAGRQRSARKSKGLLRRILGYPTIIIFALALAVLITYFLLKIGF